jgi:hypothetical protein
LPFEHVSDAKHKVSSVNSVDHCSYLHSLRATAYRSRRQDVCLLQNGMTSQVVAVVVLRFHQRTTLGYAARVVT